MSVDASPVEGGKPEAGEGDGPVLLLLQGRTLDGLSSHPFQYPGPRLNPTTTARMYFSFVTTICRRGATAAFRRS